MAGFALLKLSDLGVALKRLPFGDHGVAHLVRAGGDILASSDDAVMAYTERTKVPYNVAASDDALIRKMGSYLRKWGLQVENGSNADGSLFLLPYQTNQYGVSFKQGGNGWRLEAKMLERSMSGLPWTLVLLTRDDDFDGGVQALIRNSAIAAAIICILAMLVSFLVTRCISKPLLSVVDFMGKAVKVIRMERGQGQRLALADLCEAWSISSGMTLPPLANSIATQHAGAVQMATVKELPQQPWYKSFWSVRGAF